MSKEINLKGKTVLAPLAGISNIPFRLMAVQNGASLVFTEMVSADGLVYGDLKTRQYMKFLEQERPIGIQIFGDDPEIMGQAAVIVERQKPDLIDINLGCPVKKVVKRGAGAALMKYPQKIAGIIRSVVSAVSLPVSAKMRSGWNNDSINCIEIARILEQEGISLITIHPRTRSQAFKGKADWDLIKQVKESVSVPVIGSGDIYTPEHALRMFKETGCDLVMIGQGSLGRPWIFEQINHLLKTGKRIPEPDFNQRIEYCLQHYHLAFDFYQEEQKCVKEMRKYVNWYLRGIPGNRKIKDEIFHITDRQEVEQRLEEYARELGKGGED
ncbi:MAG: tRNA dihydrouridine synthase DusB [bacterium]